jgi:soluble lytic murein transglycosylase-like protein
VRLLWTPLRSTSRRAERPCLRRGVVILGAAVAAGVVGGPATAATSSSVAALQVALRAKGHYAAPVDGMNGPLTRAGLTSFQEKKGIRPTGKIGLATRCAFGPLGKPLLGQRELAVGAVGWDVSSLEFRLIPFGLGPAAVDGRFTAATAKALARFQKARGLAADGIAGKMTFRVLARGPGSAGALTPPAVAPTHVVTAGESFFSIAGRYGVSPLLLAKASRLKLSSVIVPGQRLTLPEGARVRGTSTTSAVAVSRESVRAALDHWSAVYGVDARLARATAWMESGFQQDVVSNVGAVGVMQLLPGTWQWVDQILLGTTTPRTYDGNVRAGVRYLRWLLDQFGGDTRLALAGYYQGAQAVRERGLFDDTKRYVAIINQLYGSV